MALYVFLFKTHLYQYAIDYHLQSSLLAATAMLLGFRAKLGAAICPT